MLSQNICYSYDTCTVRDRGKSRLNALSALRRGRGFAKWIKDLEKTTRPQAGFFFFFLQFGRRPDFFFHVLQHVKRFAHVSGSFPERSGSFPERSR